MHRRRFLSLLAGAAPGGVALAGGLPREWSRARALDFLVRQQSPDGAWRSEVYGMFRGGDALTPLVLRAIHRDRPRAAAAGFSWVFRQPPATRTLFPVHNACWLLEVAAERAPLGGPRTRLTALRGPLIESLQSLQLGSGNGWSPDGKHFGGWSYAPEVPDQAAGEEVAAMQQPNLSATVLAVVGLRAAGVAMDDRMMQEAAAFIRSCQNFDTGEERFDDGGFFQLHDDLMRNKGGKAGVDAAGTIRFNSYPAATADGITGLLLTGTQPDHPRVQSAVRWLERHRFHAAVPDLRLYSAYAQNRARLLLGARRPVSPHRPLDQNLDGSLRNPHGEMREDDPIVATSLALLAGEELWA